MTRNTLITVPGALLLAACCTHTTPAPTPAPDVLPAGQVQPSASGSKAIIIPSAPPTFRSKTILAEILNGRAENIEYDFTPVIPAAQLTAMWKELEAKWGEYQNMGEPVLTTEGANKIVDVPLTFAKGVVHARLVYGPNNYVSALTFAP